MTFREELLAVPPLERDAWVDRRLGFGEVTEDFAALPSGALPCFPSSVEELLALVDELPLRPGDAFVDIGSGNGRAAILAHLLSGARAVGIEVQPRLVELARERAASLKLDQVTFVHANAAEVELDGDVFFLYAPAYGELIARVVKRLAAVAQRRPIAVCTVALDLRGEAWLQPRRTACETLTLYEPATAVTCAP